MQMTVTERDKKLLVMLACFLIFVGFTVYVLLPMSERISQVENEITIADMTKLNMEAQLAQAPATEKKNGELKDQAEKGLEHFYDLLSDQEVDCLLTAWATQAGLTCVRTEIGQRKAAEEQERVFVCESAMTLEGSEEDLYQLLDRIEAEDAVLVNAVDFGTGESGEKILHVAVYMTDKSV